jgi:hypothetical protein
LECHKIKAHSKMNMLHQKSPKQNQAWILSSGVLRIKCIQVPNFVSNAVYSRKYHQRIGKHFALCIKYLKFLYLAQVWFGLSPREPISRKTTYANHWFLEPGCQLNHSLKTEYPISSRIQAEGCGCWSPYLASSSAMLQCSSPEPPPPTAR